MNTTNVILWVLAAVCAAVAVIRRSDMNTCEHWLKSWGLSRAQSVASDADFYRTSSWMWAGGFAACTIFAVFL